MIRKLTVNMFKKLTTLVFRIQNLQENFIFVHIQGSRFPFSVSRHFIFFTFFKCVSAIFSHSYTFPLQICRQFIKVARKERRVILAVSPRICMKTSQKPPSTQYPQNPLPSNIPTNTQPLHSSEDKKSHWIRLH